MIIKGNLSIGGKFKFSVYNKDDTLKYTTDFIDNFITSAGLEYTKTYPYADCWRYLSLGSGATPNTATGQTRTSTGLAVPLPTFAYLGGNNIHSSCIEQVNYYHTHGHGYTINNTGITLFRSWRIPEDSSEFIVGIYTFKEYGLSPGCPETTGWLDGIESSVCSCDQGVYSDFEQTTIDYGRESYDFYSQYPNICNDTKMFTRIIKDITVQNDEYLLVTYGLSINFPNTGINKFQVGVNRNSPLGVDYNWVTGSGASNIVHPGIRLINDGNVTNVSYINQISNNEFRLGTSFNPPLGSALELNCPDDNRIGYISNDNIQFLANPLLGGKAPYVHLVTPSGLMGFHKNYITETSSTKSNLGDLVSNLSYFNTPRSTITQGYTEAYPSQLDISNATDYSTIADGTFTPTHIEPNVTSSNFDASLPSTGRRRSKIISFQFKEPTLSEDLPVRAFVLGYKSDSASYWYPSIDTLFYPTGIGGKTISPPLDLPTRTYQNPYDAIAASDGIGHYFMDEENILQLQVRLSLTAPCPLDVSGCF